MGRLKRKYTDRDLDIQLITLTGILTNGGGSDPEYALNSMGIDVHDARIKKLMKDENLNLENISE